MADLCGKAALDRVRAILASPSVGVVLPLFLVSRLALLAVGLLAEIFIQPGSVFANPLHLSAKPALNLWGAWDSGWYYSLATVGYDAGGHGGQTNGVFFPAYPAIAAGLSHFTRLPVFVSLLLVSNLSFLAALFVAHRETEDEFDRPAANAVVALFCAAPGSYIFSAAYTESLFLLAVTAALALIRRRRWLAAGACAALATLTRNLGIGLLIPMAIAALPLLWRVALDLVHRRPVERARLGESLRAAIAAAMPVLALAGFAAFLYLRSGDALAFVDAQKAWGRSLDNPFAPLGYLAYPGRLDDRDLINFALCLASLALLAVLAAKRRWSMLAFGAFLALAPLAAGLASYQRYVLVIAPLFMAGASLLGPRPSGLAATLVGFAMLNGFLMVAWALALPLVA